MARRLMRMVVALFLFITGITSFAWGEDRQVTILYSNTINAQVSPVG